MLNQPISVFLDTNVFDGSKFDFSESGVFTKLVNFVNANKITLYLSHVVDGEVRRHITNKCAEIYKVQKKASGEMYKEFSKNVLDRSSIGAQIKWFNKAEITNEMLKLYDDFLNKTHAKILNSDGVDCNKLVSDYFQYNLPFEDNDKKRKEFPDAIIIQKLKQEFNEQKPLTIITEDKGFRKSFDGLDHFTVYEDIKMVFDILNKKEVTYQEVVRFISLETTKQEMMARIKEEILDQNVWIDENYLCGCEGLSEIKINETKITDATVENMVISTVDEITDESVSLTLEIEAIIIVESTYFDGEKSIWDRKNNDYLYKAMATLWRKYDGDYEVQIMLNRLENGFELVKILPDVFLTMVECDVYQIIPSDLKLSLAEDAYADMLDRFEEQP